MGQIMQQKFPLQPCLLPSLPYMTLKGQFVPTQVYFLELCLCSSYVLLMRLQCARHFTHIILTTYNPAK